MPLISVQELLNAQEKNRAYNLAISGIANVKSGSGHFVRLMVNDAVAKTVKLYDGTDTTGDLFATLDAPGKGIFDVGFGFTNGLTVSAVSASNLTFIYH